MMVVEKKIKLLIVFLACILALVSLSFVLLQIFNPSKQSVSKAIYTAEAQSSINYNVRMISNPVHNVPTDAETTKYYIMPFTDYITLNCSYSLNSENEADISVNSYITAVLTSYIEENNEEIILWEKEYPLTEPEANSTNDLSINGAKTFRLRFEEYTSLIDQLKDVYDFKSNYYVKVIYTTECQVSYNDETTREILTPYIRINLNDMLYEIEENNIVNRRLSISNTEVKNDKINWESVIIWFCVFMVMVSLTMLLQTKILRVGQLSENERIMKKINIKYGDRIVNVGGKFTLSKKTVKVESIEDVVKIADEIGQPIFSSKTDTQVYYYVANSNGTYYITFDKI